MLLRSLCLLECQLIDGELPAGLTPLLSLGNQKGARHKAVGLNRRNGSLMPGITFDEVAKTVRLHSQDPSATESIANLVAPPESTMLIDLVAAGE
jgi:hypothetical protein